VEHFESSDEHEARENFDQLELERFRLEQHGFTDESYEPYFAGLVASDGHVEDGSKKTVVASSNPEFVTGIIGPVIEQQGLGYSVFWDSEASVYKLNINDKELWETLTTKYNIPPGKKAATIEPPDDLNHDEELWLVRGWFDGDGWAEEMTKHVNNKDYTYPRVGLKSMSEDARDWIAERLSDENIRVSKYDREDESHGLWINGYAECEKFDTLVGFRHPEQHRKLQELLTRHRSSDLARGSG
jgi:hypothetical protein